MTIAKMSRYFQMPERTLYRYRDAKPGTWRKKLYYLMIEEVIRVEQRNDATEVKYQTMKG